MAKVLGSSKVGARFQVTIPSLAREAFKIGVGDMVVFLEENGKLVLTKTL